MSAASIHHLRTFLSSSTSLDVRNADPGSPSQALVPPPHYGTRVHFFFHREENSALFFPLFDSRRDVHDHDRHLLWLSKSYLVRADTMESDLEPACKVLDRVVEKRKKGVLHVPVKFLLNGLGQRALIFLLVSLSDAGDLWRRRAARAGGKGGGDSHCDAWP